MEELKYRIKDCAREIQPEVIEHRRFLHAHPELSFEETQTASYIASFLTSANIPFKKGMGGETGIVGEVGQGTKVVALRADIDALPIHEENDVVYRSTKQGVMHACGHDVHTSSLMGAAIILKRMESKLPHKVRLIFQPGEEKLPGGASLMIKDGALDNVSQIFGQHVHPDLPSGKIGICPGHFMASADEIFITIEGRGGHAARPQDVTDTVLIASTVIQALQSVVSRAADPMIPSVLSIGKIQSVGGATNIIPDKVRLEGTFRTFDELWRSKAHDLIRQRVTGLVGAFGARAEVEIKVGYPSLYNHPKLTKKVEKCIIDYVEKENVIHLPPRMTAEDFAFYSQRVPACFYRLGTGRPGSSDIRRVHTPDFDIDESALEHSTGLMAWLAFQSMVMP